MWKRWWGARQDPERAGEASDTEAVRARREPPARTPEDEALLDRISNAVVRWGMTVPAIFLLESSKPLNFVGSQFLHFLSPMVNSVLNAQDMDRLALMLERRDTVEDLITRIEAAEARR